MLNLSKKDYYIKCPYCRNIQFTLLPYYDNLDYEKIYGINTLEKTYLMSDQIIDANKVFYYKYGLPFKNGMCGFTNVKNIYCTSTIVATIPGTQLTYCDLHFKSKYIIHTQKEKDLKKQKEQEIKTNKLKEINKEREANGLKPLKNLPRIKKLDTVQTCTAILTSGPNKGQQCKCKKIEKDNLCKRHFNIINKKNI